jgi:hypothetical protein
MNAPEKHPSVIRLQAGILVHDISMEPVILVIRTNRCNEILSETLFQNHPADAFPGTQPEVSMIILQDAKDAVIR